MGEKKRRQAADTGSNSGAATALDAQTSEHYVECRNLEQFIAASPGNHEARYRLSALRHRMSQLDRERQRPAQAIFENLGLALESITDAIWIDPTNDAYWMHFAECIKVVGLPRPLSPRARETLARALEHPAVSPQLLITPIVSLLRSHPALAALGPHMASDSVIGDAERPGLLAALAELFQEPLLLRLMHLCIVAEPNLERLIVLARSLSLHAIARQPDAAMPIPIEILAAIAFQCFSTEYLYDEADLERDDHSILLKSIGEKFNAGLEPPLRWLAVSACYRSLGASESAEKIVRLCSGTALAGLARQQISEPSEEARLRDTIPTAAVPSSGISAAVASQYEENPYPRWIKCVPNRASDNFAGLVRHSLPGVRLPDASGESRRILIAGCGTGQHPISSVSSCRDSRIMALDLSLSSLAYARRKTEELGIANIEYLQSDILDLGVLSDRFDLIESIGVLHHLEDPARGWRVLRGLLKPQGLMRIALYSELARTAVVKMREQIAAQGMTPTLADMRRCRAYLRPRLDTLGTPTLNYSPDFYCASGCRDLFFHVMEHRFTLPVVKKLLGELDLEFLGFQLPTVGILDRYRAEFRDDPGATNLDNWHGFETANPWMFQGMYFFWLQARS